jgi:polyphosphate kinase 2 (PPK2 family)
MKSPVVSASSGHKIKLSKIDPNDTGGRSKEEAPQRFCELRKKICELQEILYAEHRRSLLLVFQAMDTGGKDGAINDLAPV